MARCFVCGEKVIPAHHRDSGGAILIDDKPSPSGNLVVYQDGRGRIKAAYYNGSKHSPDPTGRYLLKRKIHSCADGPKPEA